MFTEKELETAVDFIKRKKRDLLDSKEGSDLEYLRDLQTFIELENAAATQIEYNKL